MNFHQLKRIYPEAFLSEQPSSDQEWVSFPFQQQWIQLKKEQRTASELALLELSLAAAEPKKEHRHSKWYAFLFEQASAVPTTAAVCRVIQFELLKKDRNFDDDLWLQSFKSLFDNVLEAFFLNDHQGILIQGHQKEQWGLEEITGILHTLDDDFSIRSACYVGQYWSVASTLPEVFHEEQRIFAKEKNKGKTVVTLSTAGLSYYIQDTLTASPLMQQLKQQLLSDPETKEVIEAMWQSQGNISLAAKSLFIHRNTLQYRIDRLQETSQLSLRNLDDLLLCYLLTLE